MNTTKTKVLKGLTKELIKFSKKNANELSFDKKELEFIKDTAEVTLRQWDNNWSLTVRARYGESCCGAYVWQGYFSWNSETNKGSMDIYSGFTGNPIGRVEDRYTCNREGGTNYLFEFDTLLRYMLEARKTSLAKDADYCNFVAKTGCLD